MTRSRKEREKVSLKLSISKSELQNALAIVIKGVSTRSTLPVLSGILLEATGDSLVLQATDLELSIQYSTAALVEEEGKAVVPGKLFSDIVKNLPDAAVHVEADEENALITCDSSSFSIKALNYEDFPGFPHVEASQRIEVPFTKFAAMVKKVARAVSKDESRAILTGALVTLEENHFKMVATDSYRLALAEVELSDSAADEFEAVIHAKPACVIGLATGSTPLPLYRELIAREQAGIIDLSRVRSANLDEYKGLAPDHPQSYRRFMQENLFDHISIKPENTIVPDGLAADIPAMCEAYERQIEDWGGVDIQLLGLGHDGHIGFNEPCDHFPVMTHEVKLTEMTREANKRFFDSLEDVPTSAITMGIGTVMSARKILMIVTGADKAEILQQVFFGSVKPEVPGSILQFHPDVTVICDEAAARFVEE